MGASAGPDSPRLRLGGGARIKCGQFEGYEVEVVALDEPACTVLVTMRVFGRPVPLSFSIAQAAELLGPVPSVGAEQGAARDRPRD